MSNWFKTLFTPRTLPRPLPGDPFAVPEIAAMTHAGLADLPLPHPPTPARVAPQAAAPRVAPVRAAPC